MVYTHEVRDSSSLLRTIRLKFKQKLTLTANLFNVFGITSCKVRLLINKSLEQGIVNRGWLEKSVKIAHLCRYGVMVSHGSATAAYRKVIQVRVLLSAPKLVDSVSL